MKNRNVTFTTILFTVGYLALCPITQAVNPPPDGGYAGGNTAEGQSALLSRTTGIYNTGIGIYSLLSLTGGNFCTGVGAGTLLVNTADQNTATGAGALLSNTTGGSNTAVGTFALFSNTEGSNNIAIGKSALLDNTGSNNTAIGTGALFNNQADGNTATGFQALSTNSTGDDDTAIGADALLNNTTGARNTAVGADVLSDNTTGNNNTSVGSFALSDNVLGNDNTAVGSFALFNTTAGNNTAIGEAALLSTTTGNHNTALGHSAGAAQTTGSNNVYIGSGTSGVAGESNACYIGSIFGQISIGGTAVSVNSSNKLGAIVSSQRFKEDIKPMDKVSEVLFALKPVAFRYKKEIDPKGTRQLGLVAEEVEKVNPALVVRDKEGKPYSVRYDQVNAMLLNEFLKEHRNVQEQQKEIDSLKAELKEQRDLIQKVSERLEMSKPVPQMVSNDQN